MNVLHSLPSLHELDLNLLVALDALLDEQGVTRAARRMGISQSAMSHTLRRIRDLFGDPILVRARGGMLRTPRAEALVIPLRSALASLARTLADPGEFVPATARRGFRMVSPDLFDVLVLPALLRRLGRQAPGVDLAVAPGYARISERLEAGDVDLAIVPVLMGAESFDLGAPMDSDLRQRTLFHDRFRCFLRAGHPALTRSRRISRRTFTALAHVVVSPSGQGLGFVDRVLEEHRMSRRIALRVPQFSTALAIVAQSDLVLTAPRALERCPSPSALVSLAPPVTLPHHAVTMVWHPRFTEHPPHRWLREIVSSVSSSVVKRR